MQRNNVSHSFLVIIAAMVPLMLVRGSASAGTATSDMSVSASISANCTISAGTLAFGSYDPVSANASSKLDGTATLTVACTSGSSATITLGQGSNPTGSSTDAAPRRRMADGANHFLGYFLYQDSNRTVTWGNTSDTGEPYTGSGSSESITVYGVVPGGQNVPAGEYSDTVVATITF